MKYMIVEAGSASGLEKNVRVWILEGWEPQGGAAVYAWSSGNRGDERFYQAMVKEAK